MWNEKKMMRIGDENFESDFQKSVVNFQKSAVGFQKSAVDFKKSAVGFYSPL